MNNDLVNRLREPKITHHQISEPYEPYATTTKVHPTEPIKSEAADEIERLTAELDALRVYADRCRWIAAHCRSTAEHWLGRWSIVVEGPAPTRHDDEDAFYAAIDAARAAPQQTREPLTDEQMASKFHEAYERLAPAFGYETRPDTKAFDPESPNGKLMIAVCREIAHNIRSEG